MPTKLTELSSRTVTASFGEGSLNKTFVAGVVGIGAIIVLLILLYRVSGLIASVGVISYLSLTLLIFELVGGKLTLQGIAALVIGIGMAVDSVVVSFARIKEELRRKVSLKTAYIEGSKESFVSILDANVTTLIAAIILFIFGESSVKGFATMLIISIVVTFVIMVLLMRYLLSLFVRSDKFENHLKMFIGFNSSNKEPKKTSIYTKHRYIVFVLVGLIILVGGFFIYKDGLNLGIDFKGGSTITVASKSEINTNNITKDIKKLDYDMEKIEQIDDKTVYVTISNVLNAKTTAKTESYFNDRYEATTSVGAVSNVVKKNLTLNAIKALIIACVGIIIYVSIRFKFSYAIGGVVALFHDVMIMFSLFAIFRLEVSSMFIAAVLAIIGYSINDTIVSFDRIRENIKKEDSKKMTLKLFHEICNRSVQETFSRTIYTTVTTILPVIILLILGSRGIFNFNMAMLFGLIAGTYSSIFIATIIFMALEKKNLGKEKEKKIYSDDIEEKKIKGINC